MQLRVPADGRCAEVALQRRERRIEQPLPVEALLGGELRQSVEPAISDDLPKRVMLVLLVDVGARELA